MKKSDLISISVYTDGGSKGNSKTHGLAYGSFKVFVHSKDAKELGYSQDRKQYPQHHTNNEAEYQAMIDAAQYLKGLFLRMGKRVPCTIYTDSRLVFEQLAGQSELKAANLKPLNAEAKALLEEIGADYHWTERENIEPVLGH